MTETDTDSPGLSGGERMSAAEFKVAREFLGLTGDWLAAHLGVSARTVRHWEEAKYAVPDGVRLEIEDLERRTAAFVAACTARVLDHVDPVMVTYRTDAEYAARSGRDLPFPASWHRAVVARVALDVPGLRIKFSDDQPRDRS